MENYTDVFKKTKQECIINERDYMTKNNLIGERICSEDHPAYFEIGKKWENTRLRLDKPILEKAYYKIGDELTFVKRNTYNTNEDKPHLLLDKKVKSYILYDRNNEDLDLFDQKMGNDVYYENVISTGIVTRIHTSDDGSGEIVYCFQVLNPPCPECNPCCLESDIVTIIKQI